MVFESGLYPDEYFEGLHKVTRFAATARKWRERDRDIKRRPKKYFVAKRLLTGGLERPGKPKRLRRRKEG